MDIAVSLFADAIEKLKATVVQGRSFDAAQVRVIGLDDIREAAGPDWSLIKERVRVNALEFLKGCIGAADIVIPAGDGFLVLYADTVSRDLALECATIQDALNSFYIGEEGAERLKAKVTGVQVHAANMEAVLAFADGAGGGEPRAAVRPANDGRRAEDDALEHTHVFAPVWSAAHEAIALYLLTPAYEARGLATRYGYDPSYRDEGKPSGARFLDLDLRALARAADAIEATFKTGKQCFICVTVHASTLRFRPLRTAYLTKLAMVAPAVRKGLALRIAEIEPGVPLVTLTDWVGALRVHCPRVSIELHPFEASLKALGEIGVRGVALHLPPDAGATPVQRRSWADLMGRWAAALHRENLRLSVENALDPVLFEVARRTGADLISSDAVWPTVAGPSGAVAFSRRQVDAVFGRRRRA